MAALAGSLSLFLFLSLFLACSAAAVDSYDSVVLQLLGSKYTVFVKLLDEANVLTEIEQEGHLAQGITVFAPSDHYLMEKVSPSVLSFLSQPQNVGLLRKVLRHHIAHGKAGEMAWYAGDTMESMAGSKVDLRMEGDSLRVGSATIKELNVLESADGVVHTVQGLLIPDDVAAAIALAESTAEENRRSLAFLSMDFKAASAPAPAPAPNLTDVISNALTNAGNYNTFLALLSLELLSNITQLVEDGQPLTIAAPDDNAFSSVGKPNATEIADLLLIHVILGAYSFNDLAAIGNGSLSSSSSRRLLAIKTGTLQTLLNETITVETTATSTGLPNVTLSTDSTIILPDILDGTDGVSIQGVNAVILPAGFITAPPPSTSPVTYGGPPPPAPAPPPSAGVKNEFWHVFLVLAALLPLFVM